MGLFKNPLKTHKKIAKATLPGGSATVGGMLKTGGGGQRTPAPGGRSPGVMPPGGRMTREDHQMRPSPRMAEGGKVKGKKK